MPQHPFFIHSTAIGIYCLAFIASLILSLSLYLTTSADPALAASYYWGNHINKERLVFVFDEGMPFYSIKRTGPAELFIALPENYWNNNKKLYGQIPAGAALIKKVEATSGGYSLQTKTMEFNCLHFLIKDKNKLVVDMFRSSANAAWQKPGQTYTAVTTPTPQPTLGPAPTTAPTAVTPVPTAVQSIPRTNKMPALIQNPAELSPLQPQFLAPPMPPQSLQSDAQVKATWRDPNVPANSSYADSTPDALTNIPAGVIEDENTNNYNIFKLPYTFRAPISWPINKKLTVPSTPQNTSAPTTLPASSKPYSDATLAPATPTQISH
ncbi:hypothetical protein DSUL_20234 [Desulfovibrionales bacterium]